MGKSVREFIDTYAHFNFTDPFGLNRIRRLAYEYKMQEMKLGGEIERLRAINEDQSKAVTLMIRQLDKESNSKEEVLEMQRLIEELRNKTEALEALQAYAEEMEKKIDRLHSENLMLKSQYAAAIAIGKGKEEQNVLSA